MQLGNVMSALAYAGVSAALGTIGAAMVQAHSAKGESRAHAADLLADGYGGLTDRLGEDNKRQSTEIKTLRTVLLKLTDATDLLLDAMDTLLQDHTVHVGSIKDTAIKAVATAREANRVAKLSL